MTALSLDDLAALERLAKDLRNMQACGFPTPTDPALIHRVISQLRAAMEVIAAAQKIRRAEVDASYNGDAWSDWIIETCDKALAAAENGGGE